LGGSGNVVTMLQRWQRRACATDYYVGTYGIFAQS